MKIVLGPVCKLVLLEPIRFYDAGIWKCTHFEPPRHFRANALASRTLREGYVRIFAVPSLIFEC